MSRCLGRTKGGLNAKVHAVCDRIGRPLILVPTQGQTSDADGAAVMLPLFPANVKTLIGDKGCDAVRFRDALRMAQPVGSAHGGVRPMRSSRKSMKARTLADRTLDFG